MIKASMHYCSIRQDTIAGTQRDIFRCNNGSMVVPGQDRWGLASHTWMDGGIPLSGRVFAKATPSARQADIVISV